MCLDPITMPGNQTLSVIRTSSASGNQQKELCSSGDEHILKVRKTYTITKQRERWTEEEHNKFLEALKLHGRAWRRIEEHIGTKTAVQIRSHAQKFFSKVVRESTGSSTGSVKIMDIPPPRPKRKPLHPYPRKLGNASGKGLSILQKLERSESSIKSASEEENRSPTSVLCTVVSEMMGTSASNSPKHYTSLDSYITGSNPTDLSINEQENGSHFQPSSAEENGSPSSPCASAALTSDSKSATEPEHASGKEDSLVEAPVTRLKLFGRTVLVPDSQRQSTFEVGTGKSLPSINNEKREEDVDEDSSALKQTENETQQGSPEATYQGSWNPWPCGAPPLFYCLPLQQELINAGKTTPAVPGPLPWWAFCGGLPFPFVHPASSASQQQDPSEHSKEASDDKESQKEGSCTGSNTASTSEAGATRKCNDAANSNSASKLGDIKGFVPYKRCLAERDSKQSEIKVSKNPDLLVVSGGFS